MPQAYLAISLSNRPHFDREIAALKKVLASKGMDLLVFVDQFQFGAGEEGVMMQQAFASIERSDLLLVEMSKKAVGVGIETGYAFAKNIPIIYLKRKAQAYSTTTAGCADIFIDYKSVADLTQQLEAALESLSF